MTKKNTQLALVTDLPAAPAREATPARGSRLDPGWLPDPTWHREHGWTDAQAAYELEKFRDYWIALSGQRATKLDWQATWRNWLRSAAERGQGPRPASQPWNSKPSTTTARVNSALALAQQLEQEGR